MKKIIILYITCIASIAFASDWSTYHHDNQRSGTTDASLKLPLAKAWQYDSPTPPQRAWAGPAKWDAYAKLANQRSMRDFDPAFFVTSSNGKVYFGSSVDDSVHCMNLQDGKELWRFRTDGPVRIPPSIYSDKIYFGSDDGYAYCLNANTSEVIWKYRPIENDKLIASNGKLISQWPCRTGVVVQDGKAYFSMSLLPWESSYVCAVDANSGKKFFNVEHKVLTAQGPMLASPRRLYMPQGRQRPVVFDVSNGKAIGAFGNAGQGGTFALLTPEDKFVHGRGQNHGTGGELRSFNADNRDHIATFPSATCMVIKKQMAWFCNFQELIALDRGTYMTLQTQVASNNKTINSINARLKKIREKNKNLVNDETKKLDLQKTELTTKNKDLTAAAQKCFLWKKTVGTLNTIICANDILFAGAENKVIAYSCADGKQLWHAVVDGHVFGLAVADGNLMVSTDTGSIICFK
ncbi:MAG: PQQ-binding-like beta-propeller repeat protein [Phycisphaerae bacterium]|nr:PQQ-binding-like beta-propeller repeat protein [Phycisphaerae bacterium]